MLSGYTLLGLYSLPIKNVYHYVFLLFCPVTELWSEIYLTKIDLYQRSDICVCVQEKL